MGKLQSEKHIQPETHQCWGPWFGLWRGSWQPLAVWCIDQKGKDLPGRLGSHLSPHQYFTPDTFTCRLALFSSAQLRETLEEKVRSSMSRFPVMRLLFPKRARRRNKASELKNQTACVLPRRSRSPINLCFFLHQCHGNRQVSGCSPPEEAQ